MNAYMHPDTAKALLQQSRDFTEKKRAERRQAKAVEQAFSQLQRLGWDDKAARELAKIKVFGCA